ncbi:uncharacterized protein EI97DRAFT_504707 [Westerdykella ornata]|uniref:Uncharacterized protein n=1 Tax=Westerdykella ornata TaxID=318751 RepID=A0A6A6J741_WESOR|nr:uncharacterized protein EI97DRAFT_504707 [Westerdykella ornata]KAF2271818.1 hypothetical protein EI97DRAFT_504707 [Westerdykella ornata]
MTGPGAHAGSSIGDAVRKGANVIHGTGEALRGNINAAVDSAAGDHQAVARDEAIAARGTDEMDRGHPRHHHPGTGTSGVSGSSTGTGLDTQRGGSHATGLTGARDFGSGTGGVGERRV